MISRELSGSSAWIQSLSPSGPASAVPPSSPPGWALLCALAFAVAALQERVALHFGLDIAREVETGHLQELDRLHELRRHDQGLALTDFQLR